jgi:hypothetical protein
MRSFLRTAPLLLLAACATAPAATFATPEDAVQALVDSAENRDRAEELLGPGGFDVLRSGDEVADHDDLDAVRALVKEKVAFESDGDDRRIALLGNAGWPLPLPLVRENGRWRFDVDAGKDEILNRRIGRNELSTIATLRACVEAQLEYAEEGRDGNPPCYAGKWASSEGKHDGLYWPVTGNESESPLGPLICAAAAQGYQRSESGDPVPFHGYYFRILTAQGQSAPGGPHSYQDASGRLSTGFAVLAWPATWRNSGVMTFLVNQQGIVFERDLGETTATVVQQISSYDPDASWSPVAN